MVLQLDVNGQTLTELLYSFDHSTSKLCRPTGNGGLGLSKEVVLQIQIAIDKFTRSHGFTHYSTVSPWSRRLIAHHTIQLKIITGQGLGAPGILGPGKIGTFYQRIAPEAPTQSLRELLSARQDLGPSAKDCLLIYQHQENGRTDFLQNDNPLQNYGITEGSEIFLRQFPARKQERMTVDARILFEKDNVCFESGEFVQLRSTYNRPSFGLMLGRQHDQVQIMWAQEQKDIEATLLQTLADEYGIHLHGQELFLSNRLSLEPITEIMNKASVLFIDWCKEIPTPVPTQYFIRFRYCISAPHPSTWTVEVASENLRAHGCPTAADLLRENSIDGKTLFSANLESYLTLDTTMGGLGLTATQGRQLKTDFERHSNATNSIKPLTKDWLEREKGLPGFRMGSTEGFIQTLSDEPHQGRNSPSVLFKLLDETYERDDFVLFLTPEGEFAIGKIRSISEKYVVNVRQMCGQCEVKKTHLDTLEKEHGVTLMTNEIFYAQHRPLTIPCGNVIRKVQTWIAGKRDGKWFAEAGAFKMNLDKDYLMRFGTLSMDFDMSLVPLAVDDNKETEEMMNMVDGHNPQHIAWFAPNVEPHMETINSTPQERETGMGSTALHVRLRRPDGTDWKITIPPYSEATVLYDETQRVTAIPRDGFYLEYNGRNIDERDSIHQYSIQQNSTVVVIIRSRGGGDHVAGSKKKKTPQDNNLRAFEEASKNMRTDKAQKKKNASADPQEPMDLAQLQARRDQLLRDGEEKDKERVATTKAIHDRHSKEDAVQRDILSTLAINDNLSPGEEEELRFAISHTQTALKTQRAPARLANHALIKWMINKHLQRIILGADRSEKLMQTLVMNPDARESITIILRTRSENLQLDNSNGCPSEIDISAIFGQLSRKSRILTLPRDLHQDNTRRQGTDFQVEMEKAKHDLTNMIKDSILTVKDWSFDLIVDPPGTERILLIPTHHDNNQAKLLAFITGIRGFRDKGNADTKTELIMFQCFKEAWDIKYPNATLVAVRLEYSRRIMSKKGVQWVKPLVSDLGVKATEAPRIFLHLGCTDPSQSKEDLQRAVKEVLRSNGTINLNMVSDTDTSPDHTITFGLRPFNDKPETGTRQAIDRSKDHLQMEQQIFMETVQKIESIRYKLRMDNWDGSTEDARNAIRSICGDLMDEDRPASSQTLGRAIMDILGDKVNPSALDDDENWKDNIPQQRLVITVVSGISNLRTFFATSDYKQKLNTHRNKHMAQMFYLRKALQQRQVATETMEFIFEERSNTQPQNDTFVAIFTEKLWTRLTQPSEDGKPAVLTALPNTTARRLRSNETRDVMTLDGSRKTLPNLTFTAIEETEIEDNEDEPYIVSLLISGHPIFMPQRTAGDTEIHAATPLKDIPDPNWAGLRIHNLDLKHPDRILIYLYNLQEKKQAQRLSIQKDVIVWMYPPLVDLLLAVGRENLLQDLRTLNCKETNHMLIMDTLKECIKQALHTHVDKGLWLQDTPFMEAIPGVASLDGITVPFPATISELEAPAAMPACINILLRAPTTNKCQLLLDLTTQSLQGLVEQGSVTPIQKRGHTLLIKASSDILQAVLRSDNLRVGWPINFDTLEVSKEETEGALQHLLSLVYKGRSWGIVRLSVSDMADYPNFDLTDFEPTQQLTNPYHISRSGSQILTLGRWIKDSPALRQLKLAKGILIFNTPHPKGILWICPGKETPRHQEYRSLARLLGRGEETDRQVHSRLQETLLTQFDSDTSLLATLDKMRMEILLETIHPIVEGSPAILQDHYIEKDVTNQETFTRHQPTHRPQIQATWDLQPRWKASSDTEELICALLAAKSQGLLGDRYHLGVLSVPQVGTLILTATDYALTAKIPPKTLFKRLVDAFKAPLTSMEELTKDEAEYDFVSQTVGAGGLLPAK